MTTPETAQAQRPSTLPKILHKIAYSERVGKFCAWLTSPIAKCCKSKRLQFWFGSPQKTSPELGDHPLVKLTKVTPSTSRYVAGVKKTVAIISIGFLLLINLPQAGAVFDNLQDYLKPTVCVQNDNFKRCCTIQDNMHISCCVTDNLVGIEVCKDYLVTMPERASIPFQDLSRIKDQCSADLTSEARMIRKEFDEHILPKMEPVSKEIRALFEQIGRTAPKMRCAKNCGDVTITLPTNSTSHELPHFLEKFQKSLDSVGIPHDAPLSIEFSPSYQTDYFLDAGIYTHYLNDTRECPKVIAELNLYHNLFEFLSVDEIFATVNHELGHLVFRLRKLAQSSFELPKPPAYESEEYYHERYVDETFADLVSNLLSKHDSNQMSYLRQHVDLKEKNSRAQQEDSMSCISNGVRTHPPFVCRVAYADTIQNQLDDLS